jgi:Flp pilus assembly protein protease CpaA
MFFGLLINTIQTPLVEGFLFSFKGLIFIFVVCIIVSVVNGFGFGDTKLLMGIASVYGLWFSFDILLYSLITMIIYFFIFKFHLAKRLFVNLKIIAQCVLYTKKLPTFEKEQSAWTVPYACFITIGYIITLVYQFIKGDTLIWNILN